MLRYQRVVEELRNDILRGRLLPGAMLPGRRELALRFGVALRTLERAVARLIEEEWLWADARRGTFVRERGAATLQIPRLRLGVITTLHRVDEGAETNRSWTEGVTAGVRAEAGLDGGRILLLNRWEARRGLRPMAEVVEELRGRGATALVVVAESEPLSRVLPALEAGGLPFVFVSAVDFRHPAPAVVFDGFSAGYQAVRHLIEAGDRNLVVLPPFDDSWVRERIAGAKQAVEDLGRGRVRLDVYPARQPPYAKVVAEGPLIYHRPGQTAGEALLPGKRPRLRMGYIAINDAMAFGFLEAAEARGLRAGRDFHLLGFDDVPKARKEGLSSFRVPLEVMGREAARLLKEAVLGNRNLGQVKIIATLAARASTQSAVIREG